VWGPIWGSNIKSVWSTYERIMLTFDFFSFLQFFMSFFIFCFSLFYFLFLLHTMNERRQEILVTLIFIMAMHWVIAQLIALQCGAIGQHWSMMNAMLFFIKFVDMASRICNMWGYERAIGYMKNQLLGSFFWKDILVGNKVKLGHILFID
jgi:hypothetical protein